jgi:hypothetical protein
MLALELSISREQPPNQQTIAPQINGCIPLPVRRPKRVKFCGVSDDEQR